MSLQLTLEKLEDAAYELQIAIREEMNTDRRAELTQVVSKIQHLYTVYTNKLKRAHDQIKG